MATLVARWINCVGLFIKIAVVTSQCHSKHDTGNYECVRLMNYDNPQYATCLTDQYVKLKTNYKYVCVNSRTRKEIPICWYQCMVELHDSSSGYVESDCLCRMDDDEPKKRRLIPRSCHTPDGNNCDFFTECLKGNYDCINRDWTEMITLGTSLCNFGTNGLQQWYIDNSQISGNGTIWLQQAKKCFQVQMTPVLKQWLNFSCFDLNQKSILVRDKCLQFPLDAIALCDIPEDDLWFIFWKIRKSFNTNNVQTLSKFSQFIQRCLKVKETKSVKKLKMFFKSKFHSTDILERFDEYLKEITRAEEWKSHQITWYADLNPEMTILISKNTNLFTNSEKKSSCPLDKILSKFADDFEKGTFQYYIRGELVQLGHMFVCRDFSCKDTYFHRNATYPVIPAPTQNIHERIDHSVHGHVSGIGIAIGAFVGLFFLDVLIYKAVQKCRKRRNADDLEHFVSDEEDENE